MKNQIEELKTVILTQFFMAFSIIYDSSGNSQVFVKVFMNFQMLTKNLHCHKCMPSSYHLCIILSY